MCFFLVVYALAVVLKVGIIFPNSLKRTFCVFRIASFSIFDIQKCFLMGRIYNSVVGLLCGMGILSSCEIIEYHPYDTRIEGETGLTEKNIRLIEDEMRGRREFRFAIMKLCVVVLGVPMRAAGPVECKRQGSPPAAWHQFVKRRV